MILRLFNIRTTAFCISTRLPTSLSCRKTLTTMPGKNTRGALIVLEGCDKSGKSTQCSMLVDKLNSSGINAELVKFPDRTTEIGKMIDRYLQNACNIEDHAIHLLFAANRWECMPRMTTLLKSGVTLVVDRYSFSGVAFSAAKPGLDIEWCCAPEKGLLRPDCVFYLTLNAEAAAKRGDYGSERYEKTDFQKEVASVFENLRDSSWRIIDADKSVDELSEEIFVQATKIIRKAADDESVHFLWR